MLRKGGVLFSLSYMPTAATSSVALAVKLTLAELVKLSLPTVPSNEKLKSLGGVVSSRMMLSEKVWEILLAWSWKRTWIWRSPYSGLLKVKLVVKLMLSDGVRLSEIHGNPVKLPLSVTW